MYRKLFTIFIVLVGHMASAQPYPKDYFRSPLDIPLLLAGNFGECRPNHFHSGIDIKTNGKENLPVYAVADGYISRIKMEPGGFGHGLYITHPNGYTTLYAHLNDFAPDVQRYVKAEQYKAESWTLDLQLTPSQFPVKKGQQVAWSGNTGASTAPHLHFEIRDNKTEHPLNPQLFGFDIKDNISPVPVQVAIYNTFTSLYEQTPLVAGLKKKGSLYTTVVDTINIAATQAGVGINVNDYMNGSENTLTFYTADLYMDSVLQGTVTLDNIGYDVTRYLHAYIDYKSRKEKGSWIQLLFQLKGNRLDNIYSWKNKQGTLDITDGKAHEIDIQLKDAADNTTDISFYLRNNNNADSMTVRCDNFFKTNQANKFENPTIKAALDEKALYDNLCFYFSRKADINSFSDRYMVHKNYVPLHTYYDLSIKPNKAVPFSMKDKMAMVNIDGNNETGKAAIHENGWYKASVRSFGEYRLVADTIAPVIKPLQKNGTILSKASRVVFTITDNITSVKKFRGELDGKWICFEQHGDNFFYTFDEHCPKGKHTINFKASDENGNTRTINFTFTR